MSYASFWTRICLHLLLFAVAPGLACGDTRSPHVATQRQASTAGPATTKVRITNAKAVALYNLQRKLNPRPSVPIGCGNCRDNPSPSTSPSPDAAKPTPNVAWLGSAKK